MNDSSSFFSHAVLYLQSKSLLVARLGLLSMAVSMPVSRAVFNLSAAIMLAGWLLSGHWRDRLRIIIASKPAIASITFFCLCALSLLWAPAIGSDQWTALRGYARLLLIPIMITLLSYSAWQERAWWAFLCGLLFTLFVYLLDIWLEVPGTRTYGTHTAGQGVFYHHIAQGMVLSFLGAYALHRGWYYKDQPTRRWFWWTVSAVTAAGLLTVGQSRTAQVSVIAAYAIVALVHYSGRKGFLAITAFAIISAALIAASPKTHDRLILGWQEASSFQHNGEHTSVGARLKAWEFSWQQFKQSPWLGHGIGSYRERAYAHFQDSPICRLGVCDQPHNQFVLSTFEMGVLGLVAWPGLLCVLLLSGPSSYKVQLRGGCAAFITVVVTTAMFDSSLNIQAQLFFIVMAFTLLGMQPSQSIPK